MLFNKYLEKVREYINELSLYEFGEEWELTDYDLNRIYSIIYESIKEDMLVRIESKENV